MMFIAAKLESGAQLNTAGTYLGTILHFANRLGVPWANDQILRDPQQLLNIVHTDESQAKPLTANTSTR